jgi:hypothetical protein
MGMTAQQVEDLISLLEGREAADIDQRDRPGLGQHHRGRAEAFREVIILLRQTSPAE